MHGDNGRSQPGHGPVTAHNGKRETGAIAACCGLLRRPYCGSARIQVTAKSRPKSRPSHGQVTAGLVGGTAPKFAKDGKREKPFDFQTGAIAACCGLLRRPYRGLLRLIAASLLRLIAVVCARARSRSRPTGSLRLRLIAPSWQRAKAFLRLIAAYCCLLRLHIGLRCEKKAFRTGALPATILQTPRSCDKPQ